MIPAAGSGQRMGGQIPKAWIELSGISLLELSAQAMVNAGAAQLVIAVPSQVPRRAVIDAISDFCGAAGVQFGVVTGGAQRSDSVAYALRTMDLGALECVLIHDAARPLTPLDLIARVVSAVTAGADAVIPVLPVTDTIKQVDDGRVVRTIDRSSLAAVQTPQGFSPRALQQAYARAAGPVTDDASLVEAAGGIVRTVPGDPYAFKITHPHDLVVAQALLDNR